MATLPLEQGTQDCTRVKTLYPWENSEGEPIPQNTIIVNLWGKNAYSGEGKLEG